MFNKVSVLTCMLVAVSLGVLALAVLSVPEPSVPEKVLTASPIDATPVTATSFVVFDVETGRPLAVRNEHETLPIASVTKLFSAATVLEQANLETTTKITQADVATYGRAGKLAAGEEYSYRDLLWPMLLESSNDAAAVFERVDPAFIDKLNQFASSSRTLETRFNDASGLSDENVSTARELATLVRSLFYDRPHMFDITRLPQYIGEQTGWANNNPFVEVPEYRGGKHGFTYAAKLTGTLLFEETLASGDTRLIGYVVLGSDDLTQDVTVLREEVHKNVALQ